MYVTYWNPPVARQITFEQMLAGVDSVLDLNALLQTRTGQLPCPEPDSRAARFRLLLPRKRRLCPG